MGGLAGRAPAAARACAAHPSCPSQAVRPPHDPPRARQAPGEGAAGTGAGPRRARAPGAGIRRIRPIYAAGHPHARGPSCRRRTSPRGPQRSSAVPGRRPRVGALGGWRPGDRAAVENQPARGRTRRRVWSNRGQRTEERVRWGHRKSGASGEVLGGIALTCGGDRVDERRNRPLAIACPVLGVSGRPLGPGEEAAGDGRQAPRRAAPSPERAHGWVPAGAAGRRRAPRPRGPAARPPVTKRHGSRWPVSNLPSQVAVGRNTGLEGVISQ